MNISIINNYKKLAEDIPKIIDLSGYKNEYIARKMEIKPQFFSVKKNRNTFDPIQVEKILTIIFNQDVEDYLLLIELRSRKNDETVSLAQYKKKLLRGSNHYKRLYKRLTVSAQRCYSCCGGCNRFACSRKNFTR